MTRSTSHEVVPIAVEADIALVRSLVRTCAAAVGFGVLDTTMIITAASELARNTLLHGGGGTVAIEAVADGVRRGVRLTFADRGPGIADLEQALTPGFSTRCGMGLGLSGSKRLVHDFELTSTVGAGTQVVVTRWT